METHSADQSDTKEDIQKSEYNKDSSIPDDVKDSINIIWMIKAVTDYHEVK
jgi:hypothetical protein